ncbi:hypothetical protein ACH5RR_040985 [Cinchona calisaya]|uniref:Uncharacterized protein n=1 Tax=Cinchona calisaya TaxID=153742 RepID=A0ABD2XTB0_9GENT
MNIIDAASGWALDNLTIDAACELISNMASRSQKFRTRHDQTLKRVNEVNVLSLEQQMTSLTSFVRQLVSGITPTAQSCGICSNEGHSTDMCPTLQDEGQEHVNAAGDSQGSHDKVMINTHVQFWMEGSS